MMTKIKPPFDASLLLTAYTVVKWVHIQSDREKIFSSDGFAKHNILENLEDYLFQNAYDALGLKPISKCSIEELEEEIKRRTNNN